jgi:uncharacterized protein (TIGR02145 family)
MKNSVKLHSFCFVILVIFLHSCKKEEIPTLSTSTITNISTTSATGGGNITSDGNAGVTARGVCWSVNANPTTSDSKTSDGQGMGQFVSNISGLAAGLTYHIRAYATNSVGIAYGADLSFVTLGKSPECITQPATNISATGVTFNGTVNANYLSTTVTFEYGTTTSYGLTVTASQSPVTGNSITIVNAVITGLSGGTIYHFRIKAISFLDTAYGDDMTFATPIELPTLTTTIVSGITHSSAKSGGDITNDGGGAIIARGVCWGTNANPQVTAEHTTDGTGMGSFTSNITGLSYETTYYVRAYATNGAGAAYGNQFSFTTKISPILFNPNLTYGTMADIDGNVYRTIQIGTHTWMAENLRTSKYNDGTPIPNITDNNKWASLCVKDTDYLTSYGDYKTSGAYCWYNNDSATYEQVYGKLYNCGTVATGKLCPTGWHVPDRSEWHFICYKISNEEPYGLYGEELMETGTTHWFNPDISGTNETGFTALPGGSRDSTGTFHGINQRGCFWTSSGRIYPAMGFYQDIYYYSWLGTPMHHLRYQVEGLSIRCLKD